MRLKIRNTGGDTIIEVLLAIGIISLVLAGAYVASNRSLQASRAAQERAEGLKVAETQVEHIKYLVDGKLAFVPAGTFCITPDGITLKNNIASAPPADPSCLYGERYYVSVQLIAGVYNVRVIWLSALSVSGALINGTNYPGYDQLQIFYRI